MRKVAIFCALVATAIPAAAQERPGMPPVQGQGGYRPGLPDANPRRMEADPDQGLYQTFADFSAWNRRAKQPKILLFWNRELTDDTTTRYRDRSRGVEVVTAAPGIVVSGYDRVREQERTTGGTAIDLHPDDDGILESGFVSAFVRAGANLVDRNAMMRKVSTRHEQGDRSDQQFMESLALEQGVDYLVEIVPEYRIDSSSGMLFSVKITHLPTSQVKAQFRSEARPMDGPERLVAMPGGFQRHRENRNTPERVAETLAADAMRGFF